MKKLLILPMLMLHSIYVAGSAYSETAPDFKQLKSLLNTIDTIELDPGVFQGGAQIRGNRYSWKLLLDDKEPITGKKYRDLIKASLENGKLYKLTQLISYNPTHKPYRQGAIPDHSFSPETGDIISTFADDEALDKLLETEKTAVDRIGSNLEIEQAHYWLLPQIFHNKPIGIIDRKNSWDQGYIPFTSEDPASLPPTENSIALINPQVEVVKVENRGQVYPYLVDVLPLTTQLQVTGLTVADTLQSPELSYPGEGEYILVRALTWDNDTKKATITFYDDFTFEDLVERDNRFADQFFKIQKFKVDPNNRKKAYLIDETINEGYYGRGRYYFADQEYYSGSIMRPSQQPDTRAYYARRKR